MKFSSTALILLSFVSKSSAFLSERKSFLGREGLRPLGSTLAPDAPELKVADDDSQNRGALSMQIDELAEVLGGKEQAQIVWDCYSIVSRW